MACEIVSAIQQINAAYAAMIYRNVLEGIASYSTPNALTICEPGATSLLLMYRSASEMASGSYGLVETVARPEIKTVCITQEFLSGLLAWIGGIYTEVTPIINEATPASDVLAVGPVAEFGADRIYPDARYKISYVLGSMCYYVRGSPSAAAATHTVNL